ncbi:MAG: hypothetical protein ABIQ52_06585 [Vicinamibacterales bacterium]
MFFPGLHPVRSVRARFIVQHEPTSSSFVGDLGAVPPRMFDRRIVVGASVHEEQGGIRETRGIEGE